MKPTDYKFEYENLVKFTSDLEAKLKKAEGERDKWYGRNQLAQDERDGYKAVAEKAEAKIAKMESVVEAARARCECDFCGMASKGFKADEGGIRCKRGWAVEKALSKLNDQGDS